MTEARDPLEDHVERTGEPQDLPKVPAEGGETPSPPEDEEDKPSE